MKKLRYRHFTTFVKKQNKIKAIQYDGNFRCLDIFPINEVGRFRISPDGVISVPTKNGYTNLYIGDFIYKDKYNNYHVINERDFLTNYEPAPEEITDALTRYFSYRGDING